jgi:hypothetical protein
LFGCIDDPTEDLVVGDAREAGHDRQVGAYWMETGQRIDL